MQSHVHKAVSDQPKGNSSFLGLPDAAREIFHELTGEVRRTVADGIRYAGQHWPQLLFLLVYAMITMAARGYKFGVGDQIIFLPYTDSIFNPHHYHPADQVMAKAWSYNTCFVLIFAGLAKLIGMKWTLLLFHVAGRVMQFWALYVLAERLGRSRAAGLLVVFLLTNAWAIGGTANYFWDDYAAPRGFVIPMMLFHVWLLIRGRFLTSMCLAGLMFNLHALNSFYGMMISGVYILLFLRSLGLRRVIGGGVLLVLFALPFLIWMFLTQTPQPLSAPDDWIQIMRARASQNFYDTWRVAGKGELWLQHLLLIAGFLPLVKDTRVRRVFISLVVAGAAAGLVGYLFCITWPVPKIISIQIFRFFVFSIAFQGILAAAAVSQLVERPRAPWEPAAAGILFAAAFTRNAPLMFLAVVALLPIGFYRWKAAAPVLPDGSAAAGPSSSLFWQIRRWRPALKIIFFMIIAAAAALLVVIGLQSTLYEAKWLDFRPFTVFRAYLLAVPSRHFTILGISVGAALVAAALFRWCPKRFKQPVILTLLVAGLLLYGGKKAGLKDPFKKFPPSPSAVYSRWKRRIELPWEDMAKKSTWTQLRQWVRDNTPPGKLWIVPPRPENFRVISQRSTVVTCKDGTLSNFDIEFGREWWRRAKDFRLAIRIGGSNTKHYNRLRENEIRKLAEKYGAEYIVRRKIKAREVYGKKPPENLNPIRC